MTAFPDLALLDSWRAALNRLLVRGDTTYARPRLTRCAFLAHEVPRYGRLSGASLVEVHKELAEAISMLDRSPQAPKSA